MENNMKVYLVKVTVRLLLVVLVSSFLFGSIKQFSNLYKYREIDDNRKQFETQIRDNHYKLSVAGFSDEEIEPTLKELRTNVWILERAAVHKDDETQKNMKFLFGIPLLSLFAWCVISFALIGRVMHPREILKKDA
jgi:hypothetical protein